MDSFRVRKRPYEQSPLSSSKKPRRGGGLETVHKQGIEGPVADTTSAPCTPRGPAASREASGKPAGASTVKKVASSTPQKLKSAIQRLPSSYALLADMFGKLQTVFLLYKSRGQRCTFQNSKRPVEECCGRQFTAKHLLQLQHVFPEALQLSYAVVARGQTPGGSGRGDTQLVIDMPLTGRASSTQDLRQELVERLMTYFQAHYRQHCGHMQPAPAALDDPSAWDPSFDSSSVPEIPQAALPPMQNMPGSPACASPSIASPATPATGAPGPTPRSTAGKPPTVPRTARPMAKRLSFGMPGGALPAERPAGQPSTAASGSEGLITLDEDGMDDDVGNTLGARLRRESMDGSLPVSLQALRAVRQHSAETDALSCSTAAAQRQRASAFALLPKTFDAVRSAFGASGPNVQPQQQVVQMLLSSRVCGSQPEDVQSQLALLTEWVPEYLTRETRMGQGIVLRINRKADLRSVREKIQGLAVAFRG